MSEMDEMAEALGAHWRGMYGDSGLLLVNAIREPTEAELDAIDAAVKPIVKGPLTGAVIVNQDRPTFTSTQRSYQLVPTDGMLPDPANHPEYTDQHTPDALSKVGAWRWKIIAKHKDTILPLIQGKRTIDFGGMAGPVGYGSIIVDQGSKEYPALYDVEGEVNTIFTSHTLEHVRDAEGLLRAMGGKLATGGHLIVVVPSWRFEYLRADSYPHHHHTFYSLKDLVPENAGKLDLAKWRCLEHPLFEWADVLAMDDDGESILVIARKR